MNEREMRELVDAMIMTKKGFMRGFIKKNYDKEGTYTLVIDTDVHPTVKPGDKMQFTDVLIPYIK